MVLENRAVTRFAGHVDIRAEPRHTIESWEHAARKEGAHLPHTIKSPITILTATLIGRTTQPETLLGWIALIQKPGTTANIRSWYVRPRYRYLGIGKRLLQAAADEAATLGYQTVEIRTTIEAVTRYGYIPTGYQRQGGRRERAYRLDLSGWADRQTTLV